MKNKYLLALGLVVVIGLAACNQNAEVATTSEDTSINEEFVLEQLASQIESTQMVSEYSKGTTSDEMESVSFGRYPQVDTTGKKKNPVEWLVLDKQGDKVLLLSKYILDCKSYNDTDSDVTWEDCSLRKWLNESFYDTAFTEDEKKCIETTTIANTGNDEYETSGGNDTVDKVFLLGIEDVEKYFAKDNMQSDNERLATTGTDYAKNVKNKDEVLYVNTSGDWFGGKSPFWLRSPGNKQNHAARIRVTGYLGVHGINVTRTDNGVRPAIWVSLQ